MWGTLGIVTASIYYPLAYKITILELLQNIVSDAIGRKAFTGGIATAALSLTFHYLIAMTWTIFFLLIFPLIRNLLKNTVVIGIAMVCSHGSS
jgi:hypothetical protein